jgi:hypothetical protein
MASELGIARALDRLATGDDDGGKAAPKIRKADMLPNLRVAADLDAEGLNHRDFCTDEFSRQAITRYAGVQHAGRLRFHLKDRGAKSHQGEIVSRG